VWVSVLARLGSLFLAAFLALVTHLVSTLVAATAAVTALGAAIQYGRLFNTLSRKPLWPRFEPEAMRALFGFGMFSWFQAVAGVVFGQADRLLLGASVGAAAVGSYALCTQLAQPVYGIAAAGLHFVFPLLAGRSASRQATPLRPILLWAFAANALFVAVATSLLLLCGPSVLRAWAGGEIASEAASLLPVIAWATALLSMSVTATYALFALGRVRVVTLVNVAGGLFSLLWMLAVVQREGTHGVALAKLFYGAWTLCLYVPLAMQLMKVRSTERSPEASAPIAEEA
jgi:O-antigen/teichoic acid export membrane protein